jgi:hypothetical protein
MRADSFAYTLYGASQQKCEERCVHSEALIREKRMPSSGLNTQKTIPSGLLLRPESQQKAQQLCVCTATWVQHCCSKSRSKAVFGAKRRGLVAGSIYSGPGSS